MTGAIEDKKKEERVGGGEGERDGERKEEREMRSGQGSFKRESGKCAQVVILVPATEGLSYQNPIDKPIQMPEY